MTCFTIGENKRLVVLFLFLAFLFPFLAATSEATYQNPKMNIIFLDDGVIGLPMGSEPKRNRWIEWEQRLPTFINKLGLIAQFQRATGDNADNQASLYTLEISSSLSPEQKEGIVTAELYKISELTKRPSIILARSSSGNDQLRIVFQDFQDYPPEHASKFLRVLGEISPPFTERHIADNFGPFKSPPTLIFDPRIDALNINIKCELLSQKRWGVLEETYLLPHYVLHMLAAINKKITIESGTFYVVSVPEAGAVLALSSSIDTYNRAVGFLENISGHHFPLETKIPIEFLPALIKDVYASNKNSFSPATSYTLEQIGKFGLKTLPTVVDALKAANKLPESFKIAPTTFGIDELVAGGASQMGRGRMGIEEITHYLDGFSKMTAAFAGYLVSGPEGAKLAESGAGLAQNVLRGLTMPLFQEMANQPVRRDMVKNWLIIQEKQIYNDQTVIRFSEMYGLANLKQVGFRQSEVADLDRSVDLANNTRGSSGIRAPLYIPSSSYEGRVPGYNKVPDYWTYMDRPFAEASTMATMISHEHRDKVLIVGDANDPRVKLMKSSLPQGTETKVVPYEGRLNAQIEARKNHADVILGIARSTDTNFVQEKGGILFDKGNYYFLDLSGRVTLLGEKALASLDASGNSSGTFKEDNEIKQAVGISMGGKGKGFVNEIKGDLLIYQPDLFGKEPGFLPFGLARFKTFGQEAMLKFGSGWTFDPLIWTFDPLIMTGKDSLKEPDFSINKEVILMPLETGNHLNYILKYPNSKEKDIDNLSNSKPIFFMKKESDLQPDFLSNTDGTYSWLLAHGVQVIFNKTGLIQEIRQTGGENVKYIRSENKVVEKRASNNRSLKIEYEQEIPVKATMEGLAPVKYEYESKRLVKFKGQDGSFIFKYNDSLELSVLQGDDSVVKMKYSPKGELIQLSADEKNIVLESVTSKNILRISGAGQKMVEWHFRPNQGIAGVTRGNTGIFWTSSSDGRIIQMALGSITSSEDGYQFQPSIIIGAIP